MSSSRPKKSAASASSNARRPLYGLAAIAAAVLGARRVPPPPRPPERHVVGRVVRLGAQAHHVDGIGEPLERDGAAVHVGDAVHLPGEVHHLAAREDFGRTCDRAEPGRQVQRPAAEATLDGHGFAGVQSDPDRKRERRFGDRRIDEPSLELDRGADGSSR
jgi:hypothetical protein